jgi:hypothetical protein
VVTLSQGFTEGCVICQRSCHEQLPTARTTFCRIGNSICGTSFTRRFVCHFFSFFFLFLRVESFGTFLRLPWCIVHLPFFEVIWSWCSDYKNAITGNNKRKTILRSLSQNNLFCDIVEKLRSSAKNYPRAYSLLADVPTGIYST